MSITTAWTHITDLEVNDFKSLEITEKNIEFKDIFSQGKVREYNRAKEKKLRQGKATIKVKTSEKNPIHLSTI